VFSNNINL